MRLRKRYESDLSRFAAEFRDEAHLRGVLADLFGRAGAKRVRISHGTSERGKDIVFYMSGGLSKDVLYACVVKNERLSGQAQSNLGAQTVLNQALQALNEPYTDRTTGLEERVHTVYVVSPHEATTEAAESIRAQLRNQARQVEFLCGIDLLAFFQEHWPDFLRFESAVLTRYLTDLRNGLEIDRPLISLLTRNAGGLGLRPFEACYVANNVQLRVDRFLAPEASLPMADLFTNFVTEAELEMAVSHLRFWKLAFRPTDVMGIDSNATENHRRLIEEVSRNYRNYWEKGLHTRRFRDSPKQPEERQLFAIEDVKRRYSSCHIATRQIRDRLRQVEKASQTAVQFSGLSSTDPKAILTNEHFIVACSGYDIQSALPGLLRCTSATSVTIQPETLFGEGRATLISGPPGSGKTSFCRWHTLRAIDEYAADPTKALPIYLPAHRLAGEKIESFESSMLASISSGESGAEKSDIEALPVRLFLDGLDEVPDREQQRKIVEAVRDGLRRHPKLSVLITARPYVWGSWLGWLPRVHITDLSLDQQATLASNWLGDPGSIEEFYRGLEAAPGLHKLMKVPLLATLILNLFRRAAVLPENKVSLYRTFVDLYCGGWDAAKGLTKASRFKSEQKIRLLTALAYRLHVAHKTECSEERFKQVIAETLPALIADSDDVLTEVIQDGILVRAGRDLLFAHLSFQEYLASNYLPSDPLGGRPKQALVSYLRGKDWWREVVEFYVVSRDDPAALNNWITRSVRTVQRTHDVAQRLDHLSIVVRDAFPGFSPTFM